MSEETNPAVSQFDALRSRYDALYRDASLADLKSRITEITRDVGKLPGEIASVRERGYAFASYLEQKASVLAQQWDDIRQQVESLITEEGDRLRRDVERLRHRVDAGANLRANPAALQSQLPDLQRGVEMAESLRKDATSRAENLYSTLASDASRTLQQLSTINWYLDQRDEASFEFLAAEKLFLAAKAEWVEKGKSKDDPDGILYLTDQRLIFEQKETTGKKLGLFGGKKTQEVEWALPLNQIEGVQAENKGFLGGKDMLNFTLGSGAPYSQITVEVKGGVQSKFWAAQIERMIKGETDDERAIQLEPEMIEAIRNAPTECFSCGGTLPQLVAGQRQMECPYCGAVVRV